ncbi:MAG TPA: hypothetical protein VK737_12115 [Opitutales bacterium]|nr:hypothetical protein [Opitutales bacterium]
MQKKSSPTDVAELELALEKSRQVPGFRTLLAFFWGLILAKCLFAQWAFTVYNLPINPGFYVWTLSLVGSGAISLVYAYWLFRELPTMPLSGRIASATWVGCGVGFALLALVAGVYQAFSIYLLPALAAVLLGVGYFIHSVAQRRNLFKFVAIGWWLAALGLFTQPNINSLAWMALSLLLFQAAPAGWLFFTRNRQN